MAHPGLAIMLGAPKDEHDEDEHDGEDEDLSSEEHAKAKTAAVEEMMSSLRKNDKEAFQTALEGFIDLHDASKEEGDAEIEDDDAAKDTDDEDDLRL